MLEDEKDLDKHIWRGKASQVEGRHTHRHLTSRLHQSGDSKRSRTAGEVSLWRERCKEVWDLPRERSKWLGSIKSMSLSYFSSYLDVYLLSSISSWQCAKFYMITESNSSITV